MPEEIHLIAKEKLETDLKASADRLVEVLAGRNPSDIPSNDEYWDALKHHRRAHHDHNKRKENV